MPVLNLRCDLESGEGEAPWSQCRLYHPDLLLRVGDTLLPCHQAVLAQHSLLLRDIIQRKREEVAIILDEDVDIDVLEVVLDIIYRGEGRVPNNPEKFQSIVNMLQIDSFFLKDYNHAADNGDTQSLIKSDLKLSESRSVEDQADADSDFSSIFLTSGSDQDEIDKLVKTNNITESIDIFEDGSFMEEIEEIVEFFGDDNPTRKRDLKLSESKSLEDQCDASTEYSAVFLTSNQGEIEKLVKSNATDMFEDDNFFVTVCEMADVGSVDPALRTQTEDEKALRVPSHTEGKLREKTNEEEDIDDDIIYKLHEENKMRRLYKLIDIESDDIIEISGGIEGRKGSRVSRPGQKTDRDQDDSDLLLESPNNKGNFSIELQDHKTL